MRGTRERPTVVSDAGLKFLAGGEFACLGMDSRLTSPISRHSLPPMFGNNLFVVLMAAGALALLAYLALQLAGQFD